MNVERLLAFPRGTRRAFAAAGLGAMAALAAVPALAQAEAFPTRPIRAVLGGPAGSGLEVVMRLLAPTMQAALGQPVVIDPRPGAEGIIAADLVARAPADGYTLLVATYTQLVSNPVLRDALSYDVERDFAPVTLLTEHHLVLAAHPSFAPRTLAELRDHARESRAAPVDVAVPASTFDVIARALAGAMDAPLRTVPYNQMTAAFQAVLGGQVPLAILDASVALDAIRAGRLRALAIGARERLAVLPGVPTFAESGYPVVNHPMWVALVAPAGVPGEIVDRVRRAVRRALEAGDVRERLLALAIVPRPSSGAELAATIANDQASFAREAKRWGASAN